MFYLQKLFRLRYVAAVNCWTLSGECIKELKSGQLLLGERNFPSGRQGKRNPSGTKHYNINQPYPIFVFYPRGRKGIQYNGPISYHHIMEFILTAKNPVKHVTSIDDWDEMRALHGGFSLVGYFPDIYQNLDSLRNYRTFLSASYHMLEVDPFRTYLGGVAAVTSPSLAVRLHLNSSTGPPVRFALWNGTSFAHPNKTVGISRTSIDNLYNWVK